MRWCSARSQARTRVTEKKKNSDAYFGRANLNSAFCHAGEVMPEEDSNLVQNSTQKSIVAHCPAANTQRAIINNRYLAERSLAGFAYQDIFNHRCYKARHTNAIIVHHSCRSTEIHKDVKSYYEPVPHYVVRERVMRWSSTAR